MDLLRVFLPFSKGQRAMGNTFCVPCPVSFPCQDKQTFSSDLSPAGSLGAECTKCIHREFS